MTDEIGALSKIGQCHSAYQDALDLSRLKKSRSVRLQLSSSPNARVAGKHINHPSDCVLSAFHPLEPTCVQGHCGYPMTE